jgi:hypothetical protein
MSLEAKSLHVRLAPDMHDRLAVLAAINNDGLAEYAAHLPEKAIVGEFHAVTMQADRLRRLGFGGISRDSQGSPGIGRESGR